MSDPKTPFYVCIQTQSVLWAIPPADLARENHLRVFLFDEHSDKEEPSLSASISVEAPDGSVVLDSQFPDSHPQDLGALEELLDTGLIFSTPWIGSRFVTRFVEQKRGRPFPKPSQPLDVKAV